MKIELTAGCTVDSLLVNGKRFETLPYDEIRNVITILLDWYKDTDLCNDILRDIVCSKGEFKDGYTCVQCGDFVETYTLEI
jgi:hypothetical protein